MKRVIRGRTYNTETSKLITEYSHGYPGDPGHYRENLYRTPRNAYFLACHGGVRSHYAYEFRDGQFRTSDDVIPLNDEQVLRWLEDHERSDEIEALFGKQPEAGDGAVMICLRLPEALNGRVVQAARRSGRDVHTWLNDAIERALAPGP